MDVKLASQPRGAYPWRHSLQVLPPNHHGAAWKRVQRSHQPVTATRLSLQLGIGRCTFRSAPSIIEDLRIVRVQIRRCFQAQKEAAPLDKQPLQRTCLLASGGQHLCCWRVQLVVCMLHLVDNLPQRGGHPELGADTDAARGNDCVNGQFGRKQNPSNASIHFQRRIAVDLGNPGPAGHVQPRARGQQVSTGSSELHRLRKREVQRCQGGFYNVLGGQWVDEEQHGPGHLVARVNPKVLPPSPGVSILISALDPRATLHAAHEVRDFQHLLAADEEGLGPCRWLCPSSWRQVHCGQQDPLALARQHTARAAISAQSAESIHGCTQHRAIGA
mmetsp:Transcript_94378/g.170461  ORF Transcript_94378/g.170461 Transcript_94378/m.170461 type:complete len:331 (+) Transcript_94378:371-1363(+)